MAWRRNGIDKWLQKESRYCWTSVERKFSWSGNETKIFWCKEQTNELKPSCYEKHLFKFHHDSIEKLETHRLFMFFFVWVGSTKRKSKENFFAITGSECEQC